MLNQISKLVSYFLLLVFFWPADILLSSERILEYNSIIEVKVDGTLDVTEEITVFAEGHKIKRGIFRDFPTKYTDRLGNRIRVDFIIQEVLKDGSESPFIVENITNGKRVKIGNKNILLRPGQYTYTLKYSTNRQIGFFKEYDEIYFNAIGHGWNFPIDKAKIILVLPESAKILKHTTYTGSYGNNNSNYTTMLLAPNIIQFINIRPLAAFEGMTIATAWGKGIISEPSQIEKASYFLQDNSAILFLLTGLILLLCYYLYAWNKVGKDPDRGAIVPHYNPPGNLSPAAVRYLLNMCFDKRSFAAAIVNMACKGYLDIIEEEKDYVLNRKNIDITHLTKGEKIIGEKLFLHRGKIKLENKEHSLFRSAIYGLKKELKKEFRTHYFNLNIYWLLPGVLISVMTFALMILSLIFSTSDMTLIMFICVVAILGTNILFAILIKAPTLQGRKIMDEIEGLKMYLSVAEKERLNLLNPPERTPELFEKLLPYAIALGVENEWGDQFTSIFSKFDQEDEGYYPSWYYGQHITRFGVADFSSSLGKSFSSAISSAASPPGSSSASGGGGFSGGGGGGGGGW